MSDYFFTEYYNLRRKQKNYLIKLPEYMTDFTKWANDKYSATTVYYYLQDISVFFQFLTQIYHIDISAITIQFLMSIDDDALISKYQSWLDEYRVNGKVYRNTISSKRRKMTAIRKLYNFFEIALPEIEQIILDNSSSVHDPVYIDDFLKENTKHALSYILHSRLSSHNTNFQNIFFIRDVAIYILLYRTETTIAEVIGLNLNNISVFDEQIKYYDSTYTLPKYESDILKYYIHHGRFILSPSREYEEVVFISLRHSRLTVRAIEKSLKKRSNGNITPSDLIVNHCICVKE